MVVSIIRDFYDIVIIGAGPAGLNAGMHLIGSKASILLVDKITPWDQPIQCAEGVGRLGFGEALKIRKSWIRQEIWSACYHTPDGSTVNYFDKNGGYIINRSLMQKDMAEEISNSGIECAFNMRISSVSKPQNGIRTIQFSNNLSTTAKIVIDASGPAAGFGKDEKITFKPQDLEPAYFVVAENVKVELDRVHIYISSQFAPGGYAWVFPRDEGTANIGIVIGKKYVKDVNLKTLLDSFLNAFFPEIKIIRRFAGSIPCHHKKGPIAVAGLIKAGDSASTINPISRAGISEALLCGSLAAGCALKMLDAKHTWETSRAIRQYENLWEKHRGKRHSKLSRVKNALISVPDSDYNAAAHALSAVPQNDLTMSKIFRASLGRFPRLVWAMRHLM
jgi:digeranylgeranylglycerophospholipid reductase